MLRALILFLAGAWMLTSCKTQRMICPAYQSAFVFDKAATKENFVLYNDSKDQPREVLASNGKIFTLPAKDSAWEKSVVLPGPSLPIERRVKKDRYLLLPQKTYKKALRDLQTIPMKPVYQKKVEEDTAAIRKALDSAARTITDTITSIALPKKEKKKQEEDSVYVITKLKEKFNLDQDNYMWYFRNLLVLPDVRLSMDEANGAKNLPKAAKKGFFAGLKELFKKKPKKKDSLNLQEPQPTTDSTGAVVTPPKKKFSFKGLFKKKKKEAAPVKKEEAIKEEEEKF
jgi:hypothetical protein